MRRNLPRRRDIVDFIAVLPDWGELSKGVNAAVLAPNEDAMGRYEPGAS